MITKKQALMVQKAAVRINKREETWSCWAISRYGGLGLAREYSKFFDQQCGKRWPGLDYVWDSQSKAAKQKTIQRELMLELFAHTRGKL